jgi:hypothetical protein
MLTFQKIIMEAYLSNILLIKLLKYVADLEDGMTDTVNNLCNTQK